EIASRNHSGDEQIESALAIFNERSVPALCALVAESKALVAIDAASIDDVLMTALESRHRVQVTRGITLIALIGASLRSAKSVLSAPLAALESVPLAFIHAGSSEHTALIGLRDEHAAEALM